MTEVLEKLVENQRRFVQFSIADYPNHRIPIPLFGAAVTLLSISTLTFPWLGLVTVPVSLMLVIGLLTGDVTVVDAASEEE